MTQWNTSTALKFRLLKIVLTLACLFTLPLAIRIYPIIPLLLVIAIISLMGFGLLIRARKLFLTHRNTALKQLVRVARNGRAVLRMEAEVEVFYLGGLLTGLIAFLYLVIEPAKAASTQHIFTLTGICLAIAGLADFLKTAYKLTKFAWSRVVGKALLGILATIAYLGAGAMAKSVVASAIGYDPKYFSDSVSIFQTLLTPIVYIGICAVIIAPCCIFVVAINMCLGMTSLYWRQMRGMFSLQKNPLKPRIALLPSRLWTGRKYVRHFHIFDWHDTSSTVRPMAIFAASCTILLLISQAASLEVGLRQQLIRVMVVAIDFRSSATCAAASVRAPSAYTESGVLLVAEASGQIVKKVCTTSISPSTP